MRAACLALGFLWVAAAAAETLYRLPWADGLTFMFTQVPDGRITSHFTKATLNAVDIAMPVGIPVVAARGGLVEALEDHHGASPEEEPATYEGNFVRVRHADGTAAIYAHLRYHGIAVRQGETVDSAQLLGFSGATGDVQSPHLHFAVTRTTTNPSGWREEVSLPITFYVGSPPTAFTPRAALQVRADYSAAVEAPRAPSEARTIRGSRPSLEPGEEAGAWAAAALWLVCGLVGMAWFWRFARN